VNANTTPAPQYFVKLLPDNPSSCDIHATITATVHASATIGITINFTPQAAATSSSASPTQTSPGGGLTGIIKGFAGKCVDDTGNSSSQRATVQIWSCNRGKAQTWTYSGGEVKHNGLCLNAKGNGKSGARVILWACNGAPNEIWVFNTINHQVLLKANGFAACLDDPGYSTRNGTQLIVYKCHNTPNQHWSVP
jgi:hypothetical protein